MEKLLTLPYKILLVIFIITNLSAIAQTDSDRELRRQEYEIEMLKKYEDKAFFEIPWLVIMNDSKLSFRKVEKLFNDKVIGIDLKTMNEGLFNRWNIYKRMKQAKERPDGKFMFQDEEFKELEEYKKNVDADKSVISADWEFILLDTIPSYFHGFGRLERINFHPTDTNIVWASAPEGGLWKSEDGGDEWTLISDSWDHLSVGDLVYNTNDYDTIYVATDDHDSWFNNNRGVLRSDDGGTTWAVVGLLNSQATNVYKLMMHPDGRTLFACTNEGIFRSKDHGVTWNKLTGLPNNVNDLEFHPSDSTVLYAAMRNDPDFGYFWVSTDGGVNFTQKTATLDCKGRQSQVTITPDDPNIAYIGVYPEPPTYEPRGGMIMKYDFTLDSIWTVLAPTDSIGGAIGGAWDFRIEASPYDADQVIYGCVSAYHTYDGGVTWVEVSPLHADIHDYKWQPGTNDYWEANDGSGSTTADSTGIAPFTKITKVPVLQVYSVQSSPHGAYKVYGTQDNGSYVDFDGNYYLISGGDGLNVAMDPVDSTIVYTTINNGGTIFQHDYDPVTGNINTTFILTEQYTNGLGDWWPGANIDAVDRSIVYMKFKDIIKFSDNMTNVENLTNGSIGNGSEVLKYIVQSKSHPNIFVTGWGMEMRKSVDGGITWSTITHPGVYIGDHPCITMHPTNPDKMWVVGWGQVKKTTDGGTTWTDFTGTIPGSAGIGFIDFQEGSDDGLYVAGVLGQIYYRDNTMSDWELYKTNLPNVRLNQINVLPHAGKVRVTTWGRGIWESPLHTASTNLCTPPVPPNIISEVCASSATLIVGAAPSGYSIVWTRDGSTIAATNDTINVTTAGVYKARYIDNSGSCHSYFSEKNDIQFNPAINIIGGNSLNFDGVDDHLTIMKGEFDLVGKSFTVEFWAKRQSTGANHYAVDYGNYGTRRRLHVGFMNTDQFNFAFFGDDLQTTETYTDDNWHHWACVYDTSAAAPNHNRFIYRDGEIVASDRAGGYFIGMDSLYIGQLFGANHFDGSLDELRIWTIAKSQTDVKNGMYCPPTCFTSDLMLYLPFEEGTANGDNTALTTFTDYSSNNVHINIRNIALNGTSSNIVDGLGDFKVSGPSHVCSKLTWTYTVPDVAGASSYTWTLPSGWTGTSSTNSITVTPSSTNGTVQCVAAAACGNLTFTKSVISSQDCLNGLDFDGTDDYVDAGTDIDIANTSFTIEFWAKRNSLGTDDWMMGQHTVYESNKTLLIGFTGSNTMLFTFFGYDLHAPSTYTDTDWHHWAFVYDKSIASPNHNRFIYRDGELVGSDRPPSDFLGDGPFTIGKGAWDSYAGKIDEVRVWNVVRTPTELIENKFCAITSPPASLLLNLPFEDGEASGNNVGTSQTIDFSGNGNHGAIYNFAMTGSTSNYVDATKPLIVNGPNTVCPLLSWTYSINSVAGASSYIWTLPSGWTGTSSTNSITVTPSSTSGTVQCDVAAPCGTLTFTKTVTANADCKNGIDFDGTDDYVNAGSGIDIAGTSFTIEFWAKRNGIGADRWFIGQHSVYEANKTLIIGFTATNNLIFTFFGGDLVSSATFTSQDWHHWAFSYDKSIAAPAHNRFVYLDGILVASDRVASDFLGDGDFTIGQAAWQKFGGSMDEVRVWNVVRTPAELTANMHCVMTTYPSSLLAYFPFEDGIASGNNTSNSQTKDFSGNNNNGTVTNLALTGSSSNYISAVKPTLMTGAEVVCPQLDWTYSVPDITGASSYSWTLPSGWTGSSTSENITVTPSTTSGTVQCVVAAPCGNLTFTKSVSPNSGCFTGIDFDGIDDRVYAGNDINISNSSFTVEFWAKRTGNNNEDLIVSQWAANGLNLVMHIGFQATNGFNFGFYGNDLHASSVYVDNDWHHWACVYDKSIGAPDHNRFIYRDGLLIASDRSSSDYIGSGDLYIGAIPAWGIYYPGKLDEVKIWNTARSQSEILDNRFCQMTSYPTSLLLYYPFEDGIPDVSNTDRTLTSDFSTYGRNGLIQNLALSGTTSNFSTDPDITRYADSDSDNFGDASTTTNEFHSNCDFITVAGDCNDSDSAIHPNASEICDGMVDNNCNGLSDEVPHWLNFDGTDDEVEIDNTTLGNFGTNDFTLEMKIRTTDDLCMLIGKRPTCDCNNTLWNFSLEGGKLRAELFESGCSNGLNLYSNSVVNDGNWHHLAIVRRGTTLLLYIDGTFEASNSSTQNLTNSAKILLGNSICEGVDYPGDMDEVRIWNIARTVQQIDAFKDAVLTGSESGLLAYYDFDDPDVTGGGYNVGEDALADRTSNSNDGTLKNFALNGSTSNWMGGGAFSIYYHDSDGDSFGDPEDSYQGCSVPADYIADNTDCDDTDANVYPGATEVCNGIDDDCDGTVDEGVTTTYYRDSDNDTYGDPNVTTQDCSPPTGYVVDNTDCDDSNASVYPGATEVCNGIDDDCDGTVDEGVTTTYYQDFDNDTYGDPNVTTQACSPPTGFVADNTDCDDTDNTIFPGNPEICDGKDNNCNGQTDEGVLTTFYADTDSDSYGDPLNTTQACSVPSGYVTNNKDCDDTDNSIHPYADEVCGNSKDDDCEGNTDVEINKGLDIDGAGHNISIPLIEYEEFFSVEAWIKIPNIPGWNGGIIDWQGKASFSLYDNKIAWSESGAGNYGGPDLADGDWHHVVMVHDGYTGDNIKGYVDGVHHFTTPRAYSALVNTASNIGINFTGAIDDLRYWDTVLTQSQIQERMNKRLEGNETNLVRYYTFDHGEINTDNSIYTTALDKTSNNADGTLSGFALTGTTSNWIESWNYSRYLDNDVDGYGGSTAWTCGSMTNTTTHSSDCDDSDNTIHPYADEVCGNSEDDDCEGNTDVEINKGIDIDGSGHNISIPLIEYGEFFTVEAWIKIPNISGWNASIFEWQGKASFFIYNNNIAWSESGANYGGPDLADGNWHHVVMVHDGYTGDNIKGYVDGIHHFTTARVFNAAVNSAANIGNNFTGAIDDLRYWDTVLTQSQIQERMNRRLEGNETNLVRYYTFDHGEINTDNAIYTTALDRTSNNADGTLSGFALTGTTSNWIESWNYSRYLDNDVDGYGGSTAWACGSMTNTTILSSDCDDSDNTIHPYADEVCGNSEDDDCDGDTDVEVNRALQFDGSNDGVRFSGLTKPDKMTFEAWIKTSTGNKMIAAWIDNATGYTAEIQISGGLDVVYGEWTGTWNSHYAPQNVGNDEWHHIAVVRDEPGNTVQFYIDGKDYGVLSLTSDPGAVDELRLGFLDPARHFNGLIDEVRIWDEVLTQSQIVSRMNHRLEGNETNLLHYYTFDHGDAGMGNSIWNELKDQTSNANHGNLENFALTGASSNWVDSWIYSRYQDTDGDGFGGTTSWDCGSMTATTSHNLDCNDSNNAIHPNAYDVCDSNVDNNCNGVAEEKSLFLNYDGSDDQVEIDNTTLGEFGTGDFTIEMKIKTTDNFCALIGKREVCNCGNWWNFWIDGGKFRIELSNPACANVYNLFATSIINDGNWHHVAATRNGNNIRLYVDGILEASGSTAVLYDFTNTTKMRIGSSICGGNTIPGDIDEVRIWDTVRSQEEIMDFKDAVIPPSVAGLIAYYDFDNQNVNGGENNTGHTALEDRTSNSNDGVLQNFMLDGTTSNWVGGFPRLNLNMFLQGVYNASTDLMNDNLRADDLIPLTEPYTAIGYSFAGNGGGETINNSILSITGDDAIVDWAIVEVRDKNAPETITHSQSVLIQRDGDIVDLDGISLVEICEITKSEHYIALRHRNHFGIMTPSVLNIDGLAPTSHNFSTGLAQAWDDSNISTNDAMILLESGVYGAFRSNVNFDQFLNITDFFVARGATNPSQTGQYELEDINMDGVLNIVDFFISRISSNPSKTQHLPD